MPSAGVPYYRHDVGLVHHRGFSLHAQMCAPGIIELLSEVWARQRLVLELGCGLGLLAKELVATGHRVTAHRCLSPAMLEIAREVLGDGVEELRQLKLPDDPLPLADAIVVIRRSRFQAWRQRPPALAGSPRSGSAACARSF